MADFVDRHGLGHLDHVVDADGTVWAEYGVINQPTWVFIDDDGSSELHIGELDEEGLRARLDALAAS